MPAAAADDQHKLKAATEGQSGQGNGEAAEVHLDVLAERVFELLKKELNIELERLGRWHGA